MFKQITTFLVLLLLWAGTASPQDQPNVASRATGTIHGKVMDDTGRTIPGAIVDIDVVGDAVLGRPNQTVTDSQGEFTLHQVPTGKVSVFASKPQDSYPNGRIAVFSNGLESATEVTVAGGETSSGVTVTVHRGGRLTGVILDAATGKPVLTARIRLIRADHPEWYFSTSPTMKGDFEFAVPSGRPYKLEVTAAGYNPWVPEGGELVVDPEMTRTLDVKLSKKNSSADK